MHRPGSSIVGHAILSEKVVGREGGFLAIRRLRLVNVRADGSRSAPYLVDYVVRPKGIDAVVVAVWRRGAHGPEVLVREGLRPPLHYGRAPEDVPVADGRSYLFLREVVAGIVEPEDRGEEGLRRRAALEVEEEAGYRVAPGRVVLLGAGTFPSPGAMAEKFHLAAVEVGADDVAAEPAGDGSPMEEGSRSEWMSLDRAIEACVRGEIEDMKTELTLRRLRERLTAAAAGETPGG